MAISLKPQHVNRYRQIAWLLVKYGRSYLAKQSGLEIIQCVFLIHEILELHFFGMSNETSSATATGSELDFDPLLDLHLERADSAQSV